MASIGKISTIEQTDLIQKVSGSLLPARSSSSPEDTGQSLPPTRISNAGKLQHALSHLAETAKRIGQAHTWQASRAISSEPEVLDATTQQAEVDQKIEIQVDQVAKAQTTVATHFSPLATTIGLGTLNIEVGRWSDSYSSFTTNPNWPKASVMTGPGDTSVARLRDKINGAGVGVIANVISDSTGTYLILRATSAGRDNGFRITATPSPEASTEQAQALKDLEFDPASNPDGMQLTQQGQDAIVKVNGEQVRSSSNFIDDVVPGVDVTVKNASDQTVRVSIKPDRETGQALVQDFVRTMRELDQNLRQSQSDESEAKKAATQILQTVRSIWNPDSGNSDLRNGLERIGIQLDQHQQLSVDSNLLDQRLREQKSPLTALSQLAQILKATDNDSQPTTMTESSIGQAAQSSATTSALFRQAVLEQYTNNMYAEDAH